MTELTLHFVHEPSRLDSVPGSVFAGPERYDRFVSELERYTGTGVSRASGRLCDVAPADGLVLLDGTVDVRESIAECSPDMQADLLTRVIPFGVGRTRIFEKLLEPLSLLAAIDVLSFWEWDTQEPDTSGARGLYGLREVGARIGASCLVFESARYCYLQSEAHHGLPHLLADYLRAAWAARS